MQDNTSDEVTQNGALKAAVAHVRKELLATLEEIDAAIARDEQPVEVKLRG